MAVPAPRSAASAGGETPPPLDMSHHFSEVTKRRAPSEIKQAYKLFGIPGIRNLAGGLPNAQFFPFDTLEAQSAKPERWTPLSHGNSRSSPRHIAVPKASGETDITKRIDVSTALQYGQAQGYPPLLSWVRQFTREVLHPSFAYQGGPEVAMSCGSTDAFAKVLHVFVNSWTEGVDDVRERPGLLCEKFIYNIPLAEGLPRGMNIVPVDSDEKGMNPASLEYVLAHWDASKGKRPHLLYTVTLGQNPTGTVVPLSRKKELYTVCSKYDVLIIEDEPYWYLQFPSAASEEAKSRGRPPPQPTSSFSTTSTSSGYPFIDSLTPSAASEEAKSRGRPPPQPTSSFSTTSTSSGYPFIDSLTPSFLALDTDGRVIRLDTFSKTIAPGCRLGWVTAQPAIIERYIRISETSTQQPSGFVQSLVASLIMGSQPTPLTSSSPAWNMSGWVLWLSNLRASYESRMVTMCKILDTALDHITTSSDDPDFLQVTRTPLLSYHWPAGGMFIFLRLHFQSHPLWHAPRTNNTPLDGPTLSTAFLMHLTKKPYLVLVAPGTMFSATPEIRKESAWEYYRLCFAAETDENVEASSRMFVEGLRKFWEIEEVEEIEKLVGSFPHVMGVESAEGMVGMNMGAWMGC